MKVAYNGCFGGFSLSNLALHKFAEKKGITLTWYKESHKPLKFTKLNEVPEFGEFSHQAFTKDHGETFTAYDQGTFYYPDFSGESRSDPDLIAVIEEMGDKAGGRCANLQIHEIPDGASFEIDQYDGNESVVPPRQSW